MKANFDGGCSPNPGPGAGAAVLWTPWTPEPTIVSEFHCNLTNNEAEYIGAILALTKALELGWTDLKLYGDSKLVVEQLNGNWQIESKTLETYYTQAIGLMKEFRSIELIWIPAEKNTAADAAVTEARDQATGWSEIWRLAAQLPNLEIAEGLKKRLRELNQKGRNARFKDLMNLKVPGRSDKFSKLKANALNEQCPAAVSELFHKAFPSNKTAVASCQRWYLRGASAVIALQKQQVIEEIRENCQGRR